MRIPTEDQLFDHDCSFEDIKLSAFTPRSLTYYCQVCGGKFIVEKPMKDWRKLFGEPITLTLNEKVLEKVLKEKEEKERKEEEEILEKEKQAKIRAEQAKQKSEEARQKEYEEQVKRMEEIRRSAEEEFNREKEMAKKSQPTES